MDLRVLEEFEGRYSVSSCGKVYSNINNIILKPEIDKDGYEKYRLYYPRNTHVAKKSKKFFGHRLILMAFTGKEGEVVNHLNGVKNDNRLENLEWTTVAGNNRHARNSLGINYSKGSCHYAARLDEQTVYEILGDSCSLKEAQEKYNYDKRNIHRIRRGIIWKAVFLKYIKENGSLPAYKNSIS